jgi:hypothetical protein
MTIALDFELLAALLLLLLLLLLLPHLLNPLYLSPHQVTGLPQHPYHIDLGWGLELHVVLHPPNIL